MLPFLVHLYYIWIIRGKFNFACLRLAAFLFVLLPRQCSSHVCLFLQTVQGVNGPAVCLMPSFLVFSASFLFFPVPFLTLSFCPDVIPSPVERVGKELLWPMAKKFVLYFLV
jgi:hypothetical protein